MKKFYPFNSLKGFRLHTALLTFLLILIQSLYAQTYNLPIEGNDAVRCGAGELTLTVTWSDAVLNPDNVKWYTVPFYGTPIATGMTYTTPYIEFTQAFYVDYIGDDGCSQCDRLLIRAVIADQVITPQVIYPSLVFCNSANQSFVPTVVGASSGTFSINPSVGASFNPSTGAFNPSGLTAGTYVVTFQPEEVIGCNSNPVTVNLTVTNAPVAPAISYAEESYCSSSSTVSVSQTGAAGGSYSASPSGLTINSASGLITPSTSQTGNYTVTYLVPGGGGCAPVSATTTVSILKLPTASISYPAASFTQNQPAQNVTLTGTDDYTGGTYSAPEGLTINTSTGEITPSTSNAGSYTVTYTKANVSPCAGNLTATTSVTIYSLPSAAIDVAGQPVCIEGDNPEVTFTGSGGAAPYTFVYSINDGAAFDISTDAGSNTVTLNHPTLVEGTFTYKVLSVSDGNSSSFNYVTGDEPNITITVTTPQVASFEYTGTPYCSNSSDPSPTFLVGGVAGTFSSTAGLVFVDASTGELDISGSTSGTYTVTNTIAATGGCGVVTATASVTITALPIAGFSYANASYCQLDADPSVTLDEGAQHGIYTSDPIGIVFLANGGINLDESEAGTYTIYNTVNAADGCVLVQESTSITITPEIIISVPVFNAGATTSRCQAAETLDIYAATSTGSAGITYSYALDAASITGGNSINATTGAVSWAAGWSGTSEITVTASAPCAQDKTAIHTVTTNSSGTLDTPTFTLEASSTRCQAAGTVAYTLSNFNANFNYNYELDATSLAGGNISFAFDNNVEWNASWYGVSTLTVTASSGCSSSNPAIHTITTNPVPAIPTATDVTVTYDGQAHTGSASSTVPVIGGSDVAANIVWYDASSGGNVVTAPTGTNVGTYTAWAEAVAPGTGCISTERTLVTVTIEQRPLTASSTISDKIYDGSAATGTVNLGTVSNLVGTQTLTITPTAANYADALVENGKTTTISYSLADGDNGGLATNYSMADISSSGNILPLLLTIEDPTITKTKVYDGNTTAEVTAGDFTNKVGSDDVTINTAIANYDTKIVGEGKTITVVYTIVGDDAGNYTAPANYTTNDGVITALQLTIADPTITKTKVYDGNTTALVTAGSLTNIVGSDDVSIATTTATYNDANVAESKTITVVYTIVGDDAGNYTAPVNFTANDGVITALQLTIADPTITKTKVYNGNTTALVNAGALTNIVGSDDVSIATTTATYNDANVGESKNITVVYTIGGAAVGNYIAPVNFTANDGVITKLQLTIADPTITKTKVYDGNTTAAVTAGALQNVVVIESVADEVSIATTTATYDNANFGTDKTITVVYTIVGDDADNYTAPVNFTANDGVISKKELTISGAVAQNKVYDGNNEATVDFTSASLQGVVSDETVTINSGSYAATFAQSTVGTGIAVTVTGVELGGDDAANYTVAQPSGLSANITVAPLTITANSYDKGFGEELTSPTTGSTAFTVGAGQLKASDNVTSVTLTYLNDVHTAGKAVGTYTESIEPGTALGTGLANYDITYANGTMVIFEVIVESTTGTTRKGYNTIKAAYDAINAGTHTGAITVKIYASTTETATATLNKSGEGSASYTSVTIIPQANVTISGSASTLMILGNIILD